MNPGRRRVLFLVPAFTGGVGGAERVISTLLRQIDHTRFECHLAVAQAGDAYLEDFPEDVVVHRMNVSRMRYALPGVIKVARQVRPQTILSTVVYLNVMLVLAKPFLPKGVRLLLREATTPSAFVAGDAQHPRLWKWFYRHLYRRADKIVCLSDSMLRDMVENFGIPQEKVVRIYNPVDIGKVRKLARAQANPFQGPGPHLVVAGRLRREKGVDVLLDAMPAVVRRFPDVRLAILGEGPQEAELKEQAVKLKLMENVDFLGFQANPWPYLGNADLFVLPSRFEGMPNALLEALALGTPVVATDCVGAIREIRESNEQMVLVQPEAPGALADGIVAALNKPKDSRGSPEQSARHLQKFDVQQAVGDYSRLF
jgi:glycosyltransferase involved in cell wall biosynthesis